ncbi:MAG TPA: hypothetical protein VGO67_17860 [Verrucomicrobiae bacterium]
MLIFLSGLLTLPSSECQPNKIVGGATTKAKQVAMQPIPKAMAATGDKTRSEVHRERAMTGAYDVFA